MRNRIIRLLPALIVIGSMYSVAEAGFFSIPPSTHRVSGLAAHRIPYGNDPLEFGELRLPKTAGPFPVAIVIHGGCWAASVGNATPSLQEVTALSSALTSMGIATWNLEYRRVGNPGGGWTGTFEDIANGVDYLRVLAQSYPLDVHRVVVIGHSAGGHLATWAAARHRLPQTSALLSPTPLPIMGVVNLAGPANLERFLPLQYRVCGGPIITRLMGGSPDQVPDRYRDASPANLLPIGVKQILITGAQDTVVPPELGHEYQRNAQQKGDDVTLIIVEHVSHFNVIAPGSFAWPKVKSAVLSLLHLTTEN